MKINLSYTVHLTMKRRWVVGGRLPFILYDVVFFNRLPEHWHKQFAVTWQSSSLPNFSMISAAKPGLSVCMSCRFVSLSLNPGTCQLFAANNR